MMQASRLSRREMVKGVGGVVGAGMIGGGVVNAAKAKVDWHDVEKWGLEGKGWDKTSRYYDRLPAKAEKMVRKAVWNLSRHSAGMSVMFETDSKSIAARWSLLSPSLAMPHMPATGVSSVDLYGKDENGKWQWIGCPRPTKQKNEMTIASGLDGKYRQYRLYLPLYNGTEKLEIGVLGGAKFKGVGPRKDKAMVFYGTSIVHGACASRPGMPHPAILGRWFDRSVVNLGFSGNGKMEMPLAELMGELDASVYIVDCLPNMNGGLVAKNVVPFVSRLREIKKDTPIVLVEDRSFTNSRWFKSRRAHHAASRKALREGYQALLSKGVKGLSYIPGESLLGHDGEATMDGSHPSDLGFYRQAKYMAPFIKPFV